MVNKNLLNWLLQVEVICFSNLLHSKRKLKFQEVLWYLFPHCNTWKINSFILQITQDIAIFYDIFKKKMMGTEAHQFLNDCRQKYNKQATMFVLQWNEVNNTK